MGLYPAATGGQAGTQRPKDRGADVLNDEALSPLRSQQTGVQVLLELGSEKGEGSLDGVNNVPLLPVQVLASLPN